MKEGWKEIKLGDMALLMADGPFGSNLKKEHYTSDKEVRIIQLSNIGEEGWKDENVKYTTFQHLTNIARCEVEPNDLVIAKMMPAGRTIICPNKEAKYVLSSDAVKVKLKEFYNTQFICYSINSQYFRNQVYENVTGIGRERTSLTKLKECKLFVPSLAEQDRIVKKLDAAFAKIDGLKQNAEKGLQAVKDLWQATLKEELKPKEGWVEYMVSELGETQTGTTPSTSSKENYGDYIAFIKPGDVNIDGLGSLNYNNQKLSEKGAKIGRIFKKGSILMVCIGATIGKVGYCTEDVSSNQQINVLTPQKKYNCKFLYYVMSGPYFQKSVLDEGHSAQATLPIINKGKWEKLKISVPNLQEQMRIVEKLDKLSEICQGYKTKYEQELSEYDALKQSILRKAFSGEL